MKKEEEKTTGYQFRDIPENLWTDFKVQCAKDRISMREKLIELVTAYVKGKK